MEKNGCGAPNNFILLVPPSERRRTDRTPVRVALAAKRLVSIEQPYVLDHQFYTPGCLTVDDHTSSGFCGHEAYRVARRARDFAAARPIAR